MKIAVDVMGFENEINEAIRACVDFQKQNNDVEFYLVGDSSLFNLEVKQNFTVIDTKQVILQTDDVFSLRTKKETSMHKVINLLKQKEVDGILSAGNSSVYVFLCYQILGLIEGVNKIGFMPFIPTFKGSYFSIIDVGASIETSEYDLYMFAIMANTYYQVVQKINNPSIGVLNIGTEKHKGLSYHHKITSLLNQNEKINYVGFIESRDLLAGVCDVLVTDGYTGNIVLKALEGTAKLIFKDMLAYFKKPWHYLLFPFVAPYMLKTKKKFDYKNNAGALVLGVDGIVVKTHGSADYKQFYSSLRLLRDCIKANYLDVIKNEVKNESKRMSTKP